MSSYWEIGKLLEECKLDSKHGDGVIKRLSIDLKAKYPDIGLSPRNLWDMKKFYLRYYKCDTKLRQAVAVLPVWIRHARLERRNSEARESLKDVYELETAYRAMFGHYTDNMHAIVYIQDTLVTEGGRANYLVSLREVTDYTFKATAASVVDYYGDEQYSKMESSLDVRQEI